MRTYRLKLSDLILVAILSVVAGVGLALADPAAATQKPEQTAVEIVRSWNEAVSTIAVEDQNFRELLDSYRRNPPGRVLLAPDVRAEQKKRRLRLIAEIVASHEERIRAMKHLAKAEEASE